MQIDNLCCCQQAKQVEVVVLAAHPDGIGRWRDRRFDGVFFGGGGDLLWDQVVASVVTLAYSFVVSYAIAKVLDVTMGIRISEGDEDTGLDLTQHAETAYTTL
jgi:ammonia channel protein AmtB